MTTPLQEAWEAATTPPVEDMATQATIIATAPQEDTETTPTLPQAASVAAVTTTPPVEDTEAAPTLPTTTLQEVATVDAQETTISPAAEDMEEAQE